MARFINQTSRLVWFGGGARTTNIFLSSCYSCFHSVHILSRNRIVNECKARLQRQNIYIENCKSIYSSHLKLYSDDGEGSGCWYKQSRLYSGRGPGTVKPPDAVAGPAAAYAKRVAEGDLQHDDHQATVIEHLQRLYQETAVYQPPAPAGKLSRWLGLKPAPAPRGLYLWGSVGTGKTMLMDLFYHTVETSSKMRVHFNEFMVSVHGHIHAQKQLRGKRVHAADQARYFEPSGTYTLRQRPQDPIPPVARIISDQAWLIAFDEFQVTDIGDAMILRRLFTELFKNGCVVVATSNRAPDDLYKNGLQRSQFLPFIPVLKHHATVVNLDSGVDYRTHGKASGSSFFVKTECDADLHMDTVFKVLCEEETDVVRPRTLSYSGRHLTLRRTCGQVADCTFAELCEQPLSAMDYLQLARTFHTVLLRNIPRLSLSSRGPARRFITLIDTFYDNKVRVVCSCDVPHVRIFEKWQRAELLDSKESLILMDDLGLQHTAEETKNMSIFTGEEELFAFDRTVSRLSQMMTTEYWQAYDKVHR